MKTRNLDKSISSLIGLIFLILFGLTSTVQALTFAPNGANCSDYDYTVSTVQITNYVVTAMKANKDIEVVALPINVTNPSEAIFNFKFTPVVEEYNPNKYNFTVKEY